MMTDGILLAETQGDPDLAEYNAIILDEAHERSLNIDFLLGHLKGLLARRKDLKTIITSATIDTQAFSRHFDNAPIIEVSGRLYPVEVQYQPLDAASEEQGEISYVDAAVQAAERILYETHSGRPVDLHAGRTRHSRNRRPARRPFQPAKRKSSRCLAGSARAINNASSRPLRAARSSSRPTLPKRP
jgi:hypothetical protein